MASLTSARHQCWATPLTFPRTSRKMPPSNKLSGCWTATDFALDRYFAADGGIVGFVFIGSSTCLSTRRHAVNTVMNTRHRLTPCPPRGRRGRQRRRPWSWFVSGVDVTTGWPVLPAELRPHTRSTHLVVTSATEARRRVPQKQRGPAGHADTGDATDAIRIHAATTPGAERGRGNRPLAQRRLGHHTRAACSSLYARTAYAAAGRAARRCRRDDGAAGKP